MVKASFIMGTMNSSSRISKTIDSIIAQTEKEWELIVFDDGSIDGTYEILKNYANIDNRIKVYRNEKNLKLQKTLNKAISQSSSPYLVRIDDDDLCLPNRLEKQLKFMNENPDYVICGSNANLIENGVVWGEIKKNEKPTKLDIYSGRSFIHPSVIMRTDIIKKLGGYDESPKYERCEDYELWCRIYSHGYIGYNLQESLINYHESKNDYLKRTNKNRIIFINASLVQKKKMRIGIIGYKHIFNNIIKLMIPNFFIYQFKKIKLIKKN
ncbi:glycosyltransferase family 2 protein [Enterococcus lemanii]|uniref:Glycosyltransferase family 2 protein n=1 Tax=Enterococcus lemanii TaxID=1159752 RepID=A0ABV9MV24_9ENTE|nr:glycosyltransferase [Enterococcus lemanii]MBM7709064.1 glycosyltransferase EpsE [Enterococcus lemanii]